LIYVLTLSRHPPTEVLQWLEQEEDYITNLLQKKLKQISEEKFLVEKELEVEKEYIVNRWHR
jgi:hypothetical protein